MEYRAANADEVAIINSLIERTIHQSYRTTYSNSAIKFFSEFHSCEEITNRMKNGLVLVAYDSDKLVGTGSLLGNKILGVFIDPEEQRKGIGATIMRHLENQASKLGCSTIELSVSLPSYDFYQKIGYSGFKPVKKILSDSSAVDYYHATKNLV